MTDSKKRTFLKSVASSVLAQGIGIATGFLSVSIGLQYLGPERFGIWMVIQTMLIYLSTSQFGLGFVAAASIAATNKVEEQRAIVWKSFCLLLGLAVIFLILIFFAANYSEKWSPLLGPITGDLVSESVFAAIVLAIFYLIRVPFVVFAAGFVGLQQIYLERLYVAQLPAIFNLVVLYLVVNLNGNLVMLALMIGLVNVLISILSAVHFLKLNKQLAINCRAKLGDKPKPVELLIGGGYFFIGGLAAMIVWSADNLVISYFLGPASVTIYSITFKLFSMACSIFVVINSVLWPMFGRAAGKNEWPWIATTYRQALFILPAIGGLIWIGGVLFAGDIIRLWVGDSSYGGGWLVFVLGGYGFIFALTNMQSSLLIGLNISRPLMWIGVLEAAINLSLSLYLVNVMGIVGVALGTLGGAFFSAFWILPILVKRASEYRLEMNWLHVIKQFFLVITPSLFIAILVVEFVALPVVSFVARVAILFCYVYISWKFIPLEMSAELVRILGKKSR